MKTLLTHAFVILTGAVYASTAPLITQQPISTTVVQGQPVTFSVSAIGDPTLTYQWKKAGADIINATSGSYTIASVQGTDAAAYTVTVSNGTGSQLSAPAFLVVGTKHVLYVKASATGSNNGSSWANAYTSPNSALSAAVDGDEIWVAAGTYKPSSTGDRNAYFSITKVLTILGGFAGTETLAGARNWNTNLTILSGDLSGNDTGPGGNQGDNSKRVVVFEGNSNAVVDGFQITGGNAPGSGEPDAGGGIYVGDGRVATIRNCTFYWNYAISYGGGLGGFSMAALTVEGCYFHDNAAPFNGGGGMIAYGFSYQPMPHCIIKRSVFASNSGSASGALLLYGDLTAYIDNSVFTSNSSGGGLQSGNASGAIRGFTGAPGRFWITNCTFSGNSNTRGTSGAISVSVPNDGNSMLANSIIVGSGSNPVSFSTAAYLLSDQLIAGSNNTVATPTFINSGSVLGADGIFGTRDDGFILTATSPGVDSASSLYSPARDATNYARNLGSGPDIGAYEFSTYTAILNSVGYNASGQLGDPVTAQGFIPRKIFTGVAKASAGGNHSISLKTDGTLWTMGDNQYGQLGDGTTTRRTAPVQIATGVASFSAGGNHSMFVKTDGTLWGMGYNSNGRLGDGTTTQRTTPVQVATGVSSVSAGGTHTVFVKTDGTLWAMGLNTNGQLGDGTTTQRTTPVQIATGVATVSAGSNHSLFVKTDGTLWAMGLNTNGQLGDGTTTQRATPVQITTGVSTASAGTSYSMFVKTDGTLRAAGLNSAGQLGDGTTTQRTTPVQVSAGVASVSAGNNHTMFLKADGTLWGTGSNDSGQLGDSKTVGITVPIQIASAVASVSAGDHFTEFVRGDGTLWVMGTNDNGQLGEGTLNYRSTPLQIATGVSSVAGSSDLHTLFVKSDGTLWAVGDNSNGQLGDGTTTNQTAPKQVATGVTSVAAGHWHTAFLKADGTLWAVGSNYLGQLGDGTSTLRLIPVQVASGVAFVAAGSYHTMFVKTDGTLWTMGYNATGQLGDGTTTNRYQPVQVATGVASVDAAFGCTVFVKTDGTLWAMGDNTNGRLGDGTTTQRNSPVQVATGVASVAEGGSWTMFVKADGSLWGVGSNTYGQLGDGTNINRLAPVQISTGVSSVSAGGNHTAFVKADGSLWAMGYNATGQLGDGSTSSRQTPVQVATGVSAVYASGDNSYFLTAASSAAGLSVGPVLPYGLAASFGQPVTFSIVASGLPTISYQWRLNTVNIIGATGSSYTIPAASTTDVGSYDVVVSNSTGTLTSNAVALTVSGSDISIEQPLNTPILSNGSQTFVAVLGSSSSLTFSLKNPGNAVLSGISLSIDGANGSDFSITSSPAVSVASGGTTAFTVQFNPSASGNKTAALHIGNSNTYRSPYNINLVGQVLFTQAQYDANRAAGQTDVTATPNTYNLYSLPQYNANRTAGQNDVINAPNTYSLYTLPQVQALNVSAPLLTKDQTTGNFKLTIGVQKANDLIHFNAFPMSGTGVTTMINAQGKLEFVFPVSDTAAFFKVQAQ
jgi:alpha-tubulin suppressor-like RCC1 family protein